MGLIRVAVLVLLTAVAVKILPRLIFSPPPFSYHGTTEKGWENVAEVFKKVLQNEPNHGYAYSVYHKGKKVVDLYGGYADSSVLEPYRENTLTTLHSSTKGLSALCVALLADRGLLDYKQLVTHYWPEFGANGKESITVDTLLSHQAGLYTISGGWSLFDILDNPEKISKQLAEQKPLWEPGTKQGYHALTVAMYMNELVRRVDPKHRPIHQFFYEEFTQPLGLDFFLGLPFSENYRVAKHEGTFLSTMEDWYGMFFDGGWRFFAGSMERFMEIIGDIKEPASFMESTNNPYVRHIPCGSYSGYGTARDLAKLMGILANGGTHDGKSYISPKTTKLLTEVLTEGFDEVIIEWVPYGRGTGPLKTPLGSRLFGFPGLGGQMVFGDLEHKLGFAFLTNKLYSGFNNTSPQFNLVYKATYDVIRKIK